MANKIELTEKAVALGIAVNPEWTKAQIQAEIDGVVIAQPSQEAVADSNDAAIVINEDAPTSAIIKEQIEQAPVTQTVASHEKPLTVKNISPTKWGVGRNILAVGESYTLKKFEADDARIVARVQRAIDMGMLERC